VFIGNPVAVLVGVLVEEKVGVKVIESKEAEVGRTPVFLLQAQGNTPVNNKPRIRNRFK
jgi:hypothetical protein